MRAKEHFTKENGFYPLPSFLDRLGDVDMGDASGPFESRKLPRNMNDGEIFAELGPEPVSPAFVAETLKAADRSGWRLFYVKDGAGTLWAVYASWGGGGWGVDAYSVERPDDWCADGRAFSRRFSGPKTDEPLELGGSDPLKSAIELCKSSGYEVYKRM